MPAINPNGGIGQGLSTNTFSSFGQSVSDVGAGVSDLFAASGDELKAKGEAFEQTSYEQASQLATQEAQFTQQSTAIKQAQSDRNLFMSMGKTTADVGGAGLAQSGSALDILRSSAQQGATTKAVLGQQGLITEAGYQEQAQSYTNMANAATVAEQADEEAAKGANLSSDFSFGAAGVSALAAVATL